MAYDAFTLDGLRSHRVVYGAVKTGSNWTFLQLRGVDVAVDLNEYYLREVERVVGVLVSMVAG